MARVRFRTAALGALALAITALVAPPRPAAAAAVAAPGTYAGKGFDTCAAPSSAAMHAWLASPYRSVGIYFGGPNRGCAQPNLTADWVATQQAAGWHLLPLYMGLQAPCTTSNKKYRIDPATAATQGRSSADDAVTAAQAIGLPASSALILDMEAYRTGDTSCRNAVLSYVSSFNARLHTRGYFAGFYGSLGSGVTDQVSVYNSTSRVRADYLDFARYDGVATLSNSSIPASYWSPHRRIKQYQGGHAETYGGVTMTIDNDLVDLAPLPAAGFGDATGNGWSDLMARDNTTGTLWLYPGNGTNFGGRSSLGTGFNAMDTITRYGDVNGDGRPDVITRQTSTGTLWLYPGTGSGLGSRVTLATGFGGMREITATGDLNGDGHPDLLAVQSSNGYLYFYPGRGAAGFGPRVSLGPGWNAMGDLAAIGDLNHDGRPDLIARLNSSGDLYFYPGTGIGFGPRVRIGTGWNGMRNLAGVGDFNRDGYPDLFAVEKSTNRLYLYPGRNGSFGTRIQLGTGWNTLRPLL
ncbi:hypothetical protein Athai_49400 [Actinocatenispora thailandica]|uniref:Rv2525c-like glycoside hydrolase-like domain-containing protein n=1 Tax=Actinocatenispora thailandica TaxID=227318 RepID=A0A7R7DTA6_9ACTN|nr:glycoside hydrolase domain-containing protein [Actinocatenispora thailandica]BCJ37437.1 hypothetical protein Athai_49400 [Actinocatenispora thailandica]